MAGQESPICDAFNNGTGFIPGTCKSNPKELQLF